MRRSGVGEVMGLTGGRADGVERGPAHHAVVVMVEVALPEEHRRRVRTDDDLRPELAHDAHELPPELDVVLDLPVAVRERSMAGEPERVRCCRDLAGALLGEPPWIDGC